MQGDAFVGVVELLAQMGDDMAVPKNIRFRIKSTISILNDCGVEEQIKCDRSLQELDEIANDPGVPVYVRTQIWNVLSMLETTKK
ncbi:UPF0147 family protein [Candidatus Woesearchaeota archaeon]|nr:UPF0147 family protein [Candidatus Woesearchaeota archaeon]